jgi:hypothetical protein
MPAQKSAMSAARVTHGDDRPRQSLRRYDPGVGPSFAINVFPAREVGENVI